MKGSSPRVLGGRRVSLTLPVPCGPAASAAGLTVTAAGQGDLLCSLTVEGEDEQVSAPPPQRRCHGNGDSVARSGGARFV